VEVAPGIYFEHDIVVKSGITLRSREEEPSSAIIDAQGLGRGILCDAPADSTLITGFTIKGGVGWGAGVLFTDYTYPFVSNGTIRSVIFRDNLSSGYGGGFWCGGVFNGDVTDCLFEGNSAVISAGGLGWWRGEPSITNCSFRGNSARTGGALYSNGEGTVSACSFAGNVATRGGGALHATSYWASRSGVTVSDCRFIENAAPTGGAAFFEGGAPAIVSGCTFTGNSSDRGGACAALLNTPRIDFCVFEANTATSQGGGLYYESAYLPGLTNCTLVRNGAAEGGGIYTYNAKVFLNNSIVSHGTGGSAVGEASVGVSGYAIYCSDLYANAGGDWVGDISGQETVHGNLSLAPAFCSPSGRDFTLAASSPLLPENNSCGVLVGALGRGCSSSARPLSLVPESWGRLKARYR
jgi:predicted outer membrane repeat protein